VLNVVKVPFLWLSSNWKSIAKIQILVNELPILSRNSICRRKWTQNLDININQTMKI
jgi:hypothetical protein